MKYFGTDGIRGRVNKTLTIDLMFSLGKALTYYKPNKVFIGYDTRRSNKMLLNALSSALLAQNIDVIDVGVVSTPSLAYYSLKHNALCIMISASHNPYYDNGIKIFNNGYKLLPNEIYDLEQLIDNAYKIPRANEIKSLYYVNRNLVTQEYLSYLYNYLPNKKIDKKIVVDLANGSNIYLLKKVINKIYTKPVFICDKPNGFNINHNCGSTNIKNLINYVNNEDADIGIACDGDGDRLIVVDHNGYVYDGVKIIFIIAKYLKDNNTLIGNKVVLSEDTNLGSIDSFINEGIDVLISEVGDANIFSLMKKNNAIIGGESSGHIIIKNLLQTGDSILSFLELINALNYYQESLDKICEDYKEYPSINLTLSYDKNKRELNENLVREIKEYINYKYKEKVKAIIRKSGTESVIRIGLSCKDSETLNEIYTYINSRKNELFIDFEGGDTQKSNVFVDFIKNNESSSYIGKEVKIRQGVIIYPNCFIDGKTTINKGSIIYPNSFIFNSEIGCNCEVKSSYILDSKIDDNIIIGPYAHIRNNSHIKKDSRIGNFVEIKNSQIDEGFKAAHLGYIGDCTIGKYCNWGCGAISCNYDGINKHKTIIGDDVFIGCNVNLVAPISLGSHSIIGAGSTLTYDVPQDGLAIERGKQVIKEDYACTYYSKLKKEDN